MRFKGRVERIFVEISSVGKGEGGDERKCAPATAKTIRTVAVRRGYCRSTLISPRNAFMVAETGIRVLS